MNTESQKSVYLMSDGEMLKEVIRLRALEKQLLKERGELMARNRELESLNREANELLEAECKAREAAEAGKARLAELGEKWALEARDANERVEASEARAARSDDLPLHLPFDLEAMLTDCVPGGYSCDPQVVADAIRAWFATRALPPHPDTAKPHFYAFADYEMSTECPEEWLDCACYSDGVHVVEADAFRRLPKRYFVWAVNQEAERRDDRQKILLETTDKAEAQRMAAAARAQAGKEG